MYKYLSEYGIYKMEENLKMKRMILGIIAIIALVFTACEPTTNVKWKAGVAPDGGLGFADIKWEDENGIADTTWGADSDTLYSINEETSSKEVSLLVGEGSCLNNGLEAEIMIDEASTGGVTVATGGGSAMLDEGADVTLVIGEAKKK